MKSSNRRKARSLALQAIYQWQFTSDPVSAIEAHFIPEINPKKTDQEYFRDLLRGVIANATAIDEKVSPFLDRKISELNPVELAVLRLAIYELLYRLDVPYKVVINEALELTKIYGSVEGHKYVNGVLDKAAQQFRKAEAKRS